MLMQISGKPSIVTVDLKKKSRVCWHEYKPALTKGRGDLRRSSFHPFLWRPTRPLPDRGSDNKVVSRKESATSLGAGDDVRARSS